MKHTKEITGKVIFDLAEELNYSELSDENQESLSEVIKQMWQSYLEMDQETYGGYLAKNVRKMSQRNRKLLDGAAAVLADLPTEWEAFERPDNLISEEMTFRNITFYTDHKTKPTVAVVYYWVEIEGGVRWHYDDQGLILQVFEHDEGEWKLLHQIDGWSTDYDLDEEKCGAAPTFIFDYVYPVQDLERAIEFYTPLLGTPDSVTDTQACFGLRDPMFILDSSGLYGHSEIKDGLTNGYAILYVEDLTAEIERLSGNGVEFLDNTDTKPKKRNNDALALLKDSEGNVVVLLERNFAADTGDTAVTGFEAKGPYIKVAKQIAEAWMQKDAAAVTGLHGEDGLWFDISTLLNRGLLEDTETIEKNLNKHYWKKFGYSDAGIVGEWNANDIKEVTLNDFTIVSYERTLTSTGNHPFKGKSYVTHIFNTSDEWAFTFINNATENQGLVLELDYTGHPVTDLETAEKFYTEQMELGTPYTDKYWRGYWSNNTVYGIFESSKEEDGIPVEEQTNGYVSFLIRSADETYAYLQQQNVSFPVVSAINIKKGIDTQPGYKQVVATDCEGNLVIFTEYSGQRK